MMLLKSDRKIGWNANPCTERYMDKVGKRGRRIGRRHYIKIELMTGTQIIGSSTA